jgi:predicted phage-related endonuclease
MGSSDSPAILGLSRWSDPVRVYWSKVAEQEVAAPTEAQSMGNLLEGAMVDWMADRLGVAVRRNQFRVGPCGLLASHVDAIAEGGVGIECKLVLDRERADEFGSNGSDEIPHAERVQCQHHMYAAGLSAVYLPIWVFCGFFDARWYRVERDDELIRMIVEADTEFWRRHVVPRVPPEGAPPPLDLVRFRSRVAGKQIEVSADDAAIVAAWWDGVRQERLQAEKAEELAKAAALAVLGDAERALLPDGRVLKFDSQRCAPRCDMHLLQRKYPDVYREVVAEVEVRRAVVLKARK